MKIFLFLIIICLLFFSSCSKTNNNPEYDMNVETAEEKIVATWITYQEINEIVDSSSDEKEFEDKIYNMVTRLKNYSINVIFLHVRAFDDCFYKSNIYPVSKYCDNQDGSLKFDVLEEFIDICKPLGIEVHAWLNPYRIRNDNDIRKIPENSLAYGYLNEEYNEELIVTDNNIYYNPACVEVQKYILDGIREILDNYSVDGIHIDDYFYPVTSDVIDKEIYKSYKELGGILTKDDYRRQSINTLVTSIYTLIKNNNGDLSFTISPNADIEKNHNELYADVIKWLTEDGYADYIIPQIYFGYENENMPFKNTLTQWTSVNSSKLIIGLGLYKSGKKDIYAQSGEQEWLNNSDIISNQIKEITSNDLKGFSLYSSSFLVKNTENQTLENEKENIIKLMEIYET